MPENYRLYPPGTKLVVIDDHEDDRWKAGDLAVVVRHTSEDIIVKRWTPEGPVGETTTYYASRLSGPQAYPQIFEAVKRKPTIII